MYSQNNEEEIILSYLGRKVGTFLDLGANDGITLSNTRALYDLGWNGVLIDASPKAFQRLKQNYAGAAGIYLHHLAIGKETGLVKFNESGELLGDSDVGLVSTFHASEMDRFKSVVEYEEVEVPCMTWEDFIAHSEIKEFDFISMDIEGNEMEVLPFMDLSKTRMICIEWNNNIELKEQYIKYLAGFTLIYSSGENLIYVR